MRLLARLLVAQVSAPEVSVGRELVIWAVVIAVTIAFVEGLRLLVIVGWL